MHVTYNTWSMHGKVTSNGYFSSLRSSILEKFLLYKLTIFSDSL
jgi:hypothetical protein